MSWVYNMKIVYAIYSIISNVKQIRSLIKSTTSAADLATNGQRKRVFSRGNPCSGPFTCTSNLNTKQIAKPFYVLYTRQTVSRTRRVDNTKWTNVYLLCVEIIFHPVGEDHLVIGCMGRIGDGFSANRFEIYVVNRTTR